ncbi:Carcinoembryonic antigen-related cell adhesion molecule 3 [Microtus ochrogaster]|uniref:Carcinoembryonic antigen-related cell adhesion molecule 3 n=1 Tax=Microtus ochrogaster TaxID=79684 RepID=A0A8J6KME3_MICOH|nr:Carcinoembryonic antigen-related cell adhesion molecule 3 [Microtus ochrogaster]
MAEGDDILFLVDNLPEKTVTLVWFKGLTNMKAVIAIYGRHINLSASGPLHSGRETIYYNGSLLIKKFTQKDTGFYTLRSYDKYLNIISTTFTYVHVHDFLWNCGRHATSAQPTIESVPPIAAEGGSVRLLIHNLPENLQGFVWFKGMSVFRDHEIARIMTDMNSSVTGPAHSGRETLNSDGSLLLYNVTQNDAGLYTLRIMSTDLKSEEAHVQLHVNSSLFPCCNPLTSSQLMIQPVPLYANEGESVLLQVHNLPEDLQAFTWYRAIYRVPYFEIVKCSRVLNTTTWGNQYSRRETVYPNGSLLLQDIAEKDAGMYTLEILKSDFKTEKAYVQFHVNNFLWKCGRLATSSQPTIESVPPKVVELGDVLLLVHNPPENVVGFVWVKGMTESKNIVAARYISDRKTTMLGPAYSGRETLYSDGSLLLRSVTLNDSGLYTLEILRTDMTTEAAQVQLKVHTFLPLCCDPLSPPQLTIRPVPQYAAVGEVFLLQVHNLPEDSRSFSWYKSRRRAPVLKIVDYNRANNSVSWEPEYRQRGMVYYNGSLMLQDVTEKDTGRYTLEVFNKDFKFKKASVEFYVKKSVTQPLIEMTDATVAGCRFVTFTCISPDTDVSIRWIFNNNTLYLTERVTLSPTKCGLRINPVKSEDAGEYQCEVSNQVSMKTSLPFSWP